MEERFEKLRKQKLSSHLQFTDKHRKKIFEAIEREKDDRDFVLAAILQLLGNWKTGYEVCQQLTNRGIKKFKNDEGSLYLWLHELEHKQYIRSEWTENEKRYVIDRKGRNALKKLYHAHPLSLFAKQGDIVYE